MPKNTQPPAYLAWHVPSDRRAPWVRIGAAWPHRDGKGLGLKLELLPPQPGRIELRLFEAKPEHAEGAEGGQP